MQTSLTEPPSTHVLLWTCYTQNMPGRRVMYMYYCGRVYTHIIIMVDRSYTCTIVVDVSYTCTIPNVSCTEHGGRVIHMYYCGRDIHIIL